MAIGLLTTLEYHLPDTTWAAFGINDYSTYITKCVVKGQFHKAVHEDVTNSFAIAEHIMAHAYYNYPSFDEALVKLLRTMEMAVKIRCTQLNIPLEEVRETKTGNSKTIKHFLHELIEQYGSAIGNEDIKNQLHWSRRIRNIFMHPSQHSFSGPMAKGAIRNLVNILNRLFLPESYYSQESNILQNLKALIQPFQNQPSILIKNNLRYLISNIDVEEVIILNDKVVALLVITPVIKNIVEQVTNHSIHPPFFIYFCFPKNEVISVEGIDEKDNIRFIIEHTSHLENINAYNNYIDSMGATNEKDIGVYKASIASDVGKEESHFLYSYLHQIKN
jgi:hypothetical protein